MSMLVNTLRNLHHKVGENINPPLQKRITDVHDQFDLTLNWLRGYLLNPSRPFDANRYPSHLIITPTNTHQSAIESLGINGDIVKDLKAGEGFNEETTELEHVVLFDPDKRVLYSMARPLHKMASYINNIFPNMILDVEGVMPYAPERTDNKRFLNSLDPLHPTFNGERALFVAELLQRVGIRGFSVSQYPEHGNYTERDVIIEELVINAAMEKIADSRGAIPSYIVQFERDFRRKLERYQSAQKRSSRRSTVRV